MQNGKYSPQGKNGGSPEAIVRAMAPPPPRPRPIVTLECRMSATAALGPGVSVGASINELSGLGGQYGFPMASVGTRISAS